MASIPVRGLVFFFFAGELEMMVGKRETRCICIYICVHTYIIDIYIYMFIYIEHLYTG